MGYFIEDARIYLKYHQRKENIITHLFGIPFILFSILVILNLVHLVIPNSVDVTFADIFVVALFIYYLFMNWLLSLLFLVPLIILWWIAYLVSYYGSSSFNLSIFIIFFVLGWILQFVGHWYEKNRPAFLDNFHQMIIAPLVLTAECMFMWDKMPGLKTKLYSDNEQGVVDEEETINKKRAIYKGKKNSESNIKKRE